MTRAEFEKEIDYYLTKKLLHALQNKGIITVNEYELVKEKIKEKYEPYFDIMSDKLLDYKDDKSD